MRTTLLFLLLPAAVALAQPYSATVDITADRNVTPIRIGGEPASLVNLARVAFDAHGAYRRVASGETYDFTFTQVGATMVRVDIRRSGSDAGVSREVAGTSARNALLRAADFAVEQTQAGGARGFFAGKLAFVCTRGGGMEIVTSDLFGGEAVGWPGVSRQIVTPRWSPDGGHLIFTSYRNGFPDIYLLDLATRIPAVFVSVRGTNTGGRFSPDGSRVAMVLTGEGNSEIYVSNAQGRMITRLTRSAAVKAGPCWSPDGSRLVFTMEPGPQLYVLAAAVGAAPQRLPTNISGYCAEPDWCRWNPDEIAFTMAVGRGYQIAVYNFSTRSARQVSKAYGDAIEPCWLADGRHLIYTEREPNRRSLWLLDTVTGKATRISSPGLGECSQASYWIR